jgi:NO-binding membrane sensor protein with MHYT domain
VTYTGLVNITFNVDMACILGRSQETATFFGWVVGSITSLIFVGLLQKRICGNVSFLKKSCSEGE